MSSRFNKLLRKENYIDTLSKLYDFSTTQYSKNILSAFVEGDGGYTYHSFKIKCDEMSIKLLRYGIGAADRIAILSQSMPNWTVAFFSCVAFGRIAVPILPDCSPSEIENILEHSASKALFVSSRLYPKISEKMKNSLNLIVNIDTFETLYKKDEAFTCDGKPSQPTPDDIACIIYTSGTTGRPKGVMLSHRNFCVNIIGSYYCHKCNDKDRWLSILPMAHAYELSVGMLYPFYCGASVYYISKPPTPKVLLPAFKIVHPTIILSVPLIIEKIYKGSVLQTIASNKTLQWMDANCKWLLYPLIGRKLKRTFGGKLRFFGIGGSKLDSEVEQFLKMAHFPYAIGYGLTEAAPLICGAGVKQTKIGSTGFAIRDVEVRIDNPDPITGEGELVVKGNNVMVGYYKDPDRTISAFTEDGWLRTNDRVAMDAKGRVFIKGRLDNMIVGASGENIYPEEIEKVVNDFEDVNESIVVEHNGQLVALVHFNDNVLDITENEEALLDKIESIIEFVNKRVKKGSRINSVEVVNEPFEKTATMKIRRFKYSKSNNTSESETPTDEKKA